MGRFGARIWDTWPFLTEYGSRRFEYRLISTYKDTLCPCPAVCNAINM